MQHRDQPIQTDVTLAPPVDPKPRLVQKSHVLLSADTVQEIRRYLMMRSVVFGGLCVLLILHWVFPAAFDITTVVLVAGLYLLIVGSGGLEAARLSGSGGDHRRQERLAEDALRRAGRLQSHLEPGTATDEVLTRILSAGHEPRRAVILAGNEVEDALRAVYRHFADAERLAGTSSGADLPLPFLVQELIWRGLLAPDIYDTAEPVLALREMALAPRAQIQPQTAGDAARAAQAIVLRVQSLHIEIHPRRVPLAWMRPEPPAAPVEHDQPLESSAMPANVAPPEEPLPDDEEQPSSMRFTATAEGDHASEHVQVADVEQLDGSSRRQ
ncbi:MAG TPA: hypothetical protein VHB98_03395 [Chloroflexota bacterium]|nr:hypothetical protein [Chloroflexota bacterium]